MPLILPLLALGLVAAAAIGRGRSGSSPRAVAGADVRLMRSPTSTQRTAAKAPTPLDVLSAYISAGKTPDPDLLLYAIAQAKTLGREDIVQAIVRTFIEPLEPTFQGRRPEASIDHGRGHHRREGRGRRWYPGSAAPGQPRVQPAQPWGRSWHPGAPPEDRPGYPGYPRYPEHPSDPGHQGHQEHPDQAHHHPDPAAYPAHPAAYPTAYPADHADAHAPAGFADPLGEHAPDPRGHHGREHDHGYYQGSGAGEHAHAPQGETGQAGPGTHPITPDEQALLEQAMAHIDPSYQKTKPRNSADGPRPGSPGTVTVSGRSSPIQGVKQEDWEAFVGVVSRELPSYMAQRHVGRFRHRKDRLIELGFDPGNLANDPDAQLSALRADMRDAQRRAQESGLFADHVGSHIQVPDRGAMLNAQITHSGILGVIQAAGLEGAAGWLEDQEDRQRFPGTTLAFLRTNGLF